jgi:uracil-DNA glycosylase family 4
LRVSGKEQLRRYLEQRREAGEVELVLDSLSVDEVLRIVGAATSAPRSAAAAKPAPEAPGPDLAGAEPPPPQSSANWREVLRDAGASPDGGIDRRPVGDADESKGELGVPEGITVGTTDRELFGGVYATLDSIDATAKAIASCTRCPLYATATKPVPGQGNPNAGMMVVGEAPGATEDEQGLAFVGAAGQLLTKILAAVNLSRDDVFICNVLKHRPPGNRNPLPEEVKACSPFLVKQIELVQPKVILALGTFAAQTLLETKLAISKLRGQLHRYYGVPLIVTYHPAALLRNPSWKRPTWEDVQLARRILDRAVDQS